MGLLPTSKQWKSWSLPSRLTAIGTGLGAVGIALSLLPVMWPKESILRPSCAQLWSQTSSPHMSADLLSFVRPGASLKLAQSALGPFFRCGVEDEQYWWSVLLPNLQLWVESDDGEYVSLVKAQVPDIEQFTPMDVPNTPFKLGLARFADLIECDSREAELNSRAAGVSEVCTIGGFGVYHDYLFGAYEVVRTEYPDSEGLSKALKATGKPDDANQNGVAPHEVLAPLRINLIVIARPGSMPSEWVYIDWDAAFTDQGSPDREVKR